MNGQVNRRMNRAPGREMINVYWNGRLVVVLVVLVVVVNRGRLFVGWGRLSTALKMGYLFYSSPDGLLSGRINAEEGKILQCS